MRLLTETVSKCIIALYTFLERSQYQLKAHYKLLESRQVALLRN